HQRRGPDALEIGAGKFLGFAFRIDHGSPGVDAIMQRRMSVAQSMARAAMGTIRRNGIDLYASLMNSSSGHPDAARAAAGRGRAFSGSAGPPRRRAPAPGRWRE